MVEFEIINDFPQTKQHENSFMSKKSNIKENNNEIETSKLEDDLEREYSTYRSNLDKIFPGKNQLNDNFTKLISVIDHENIHIKSPEIQKKYVSDILENFEGNSDNLEFLRLYPDSLHYNLMNELKYTNSESDVIDLLSNHFIRKYFNLCNLREKLISKSNLILNFYGLKEKFIVIKDYKIAKINIEIELTMKRIMRLKQGLEEQTKDFEHYLKHFKLKKLDTVFLTTFQHPFHSQLRKDDFEIFFRENCYKDKVTHHIKNFEPYIRFTALRAGIEIWKQSRIIGREFQNKIYFENITKIKQLYNSEKEKCDPSDMKLFKEFFKKKYKFYYDLKQRLEKDGSLSYNYDLVFPPQIININSEISLYLKELCDFFQIIFDVSMDKGKAFSYTLDLFFPKYFRSQVKYFNYLSYDIINLESQKSKSDSLNDIIIEDKPTDILRKTYDRTEGFLINNDDKFGDNFKNNKIIPENFLKHSNWVNFVCVKPIIDKEYIILNKKLLEIGYTDSLLKYEMGLIDSIDYNTILRIIEDYTNNISSRIKNTIQLTTNKNNRDFNSLKDIVNEICDQNAKIKKNDMQSNDYHKDRIDTELLKYYLILRFLKLRDLKFYILNYLNYFRYLQKKFTVDLYKIENANIKKSNDLVKLTNVILNTCSKTSSENFDLKAFLTNLPFSDYSKTNPSLPPLENLIEGKKDFNEFSKLLYDEIDEILEFSEKIVRVKDSRGNYIIYDSSLSDMVELEKEFEKIGTYYINKHEVLLINTDEIPNPAIDRSQVLLDLFNSEYEYLSSKYELISDLMNIYENSSDIIISKSLMQLITNIISKRPNLDLNFNYFTISYNIEIELLKKKSAFFHTLIDYQKKFETNENKILHESLEKTYFILGEIALDLIKHIRIDKLELETIKKIIQDSKLKENKTDSEIESLLDIFEQIKEERNIEKIDIDNLIKKSNFKVEEPVIKITNKEDINRDIIIEDININTPVFKNNKKTIDAKNDDYEGFILESKIKKLKMLILYIQNVFKIALKGNTDELLEKSIEGILKTEDKEDDNLEEVKNLIKLSIENSERNIVHKSVFVNRNSGVTENNAEIINYKIRSILNIPNPISEDKFLKSIEKNSLILSALNSETNFIKLEEGYPLEITENQDVNQLDQIEYLESLSAIIPLIEMIESSYSELENSFKLENKFSKKLLEISFFDNLIEEWDKYKDYISGRRKNSEFSLNYFFQDTIIDDSRKFHYSIKHLISLLSSPISKIHPSILSRLPIKNLETIDIENFDMKNFEIKEGPHDIILCELNSALFDIVYPDLKSNFLDLENISEVKIYCNAVEVYKIKKQVERLVSFCTLLEKNYEFQRDILINKQEDFIYFKNAIGLENHIKAKFNMHEFPQNDDQYEFPSKILMNDFDTTLNYCVNFSNFYAIQGNLLDRGLDELKAYLSYQYMHYYLLLIANQHNNLISYDSLKLLAEIDLYESSNIQSYHGILDTSSFGFNETKDNLTLYEMKNLINKNLLLIGKYQFYSIIDKKLKNRNLITEKFNELNEQILYLNKNKTIKSIYSRYSKFLLSNTYCKDILFDVYLDALKIQICSLNSKLLKITDLVPQEYQIFKKSPLIGRYKEYDINEIMTNLKFYSENIDFYHHYIPSNLEILKLENHNDNETINFYTKYNPFNYINNIANSKFFLQYKDLFFQNPVKCNLIENFRNIYFEQSYDYQSKIFTLLLISNFILNISNLKFLEISFNLKQIEFLDLFIANKNGIDFWGDLSQNPRKIKKVLSNENEEKLPIIVNL